MQPKPAAGWTLEAYIVHNEALREAEARFQAERDARYLERHQADVIAAEKTALALKEYKVGANEWRDTVKDLIAGQNGRTVGHDQSWHFLLSIASLVVSLIIIGTFVFHTPAITNAPQPQIIYVPAQPGTLIPSPTQPPQK